VYEHNEFINSVVSVPSDSKVLICSCKGAFPKSYNLYD
jgi:hypothetical protein